MQRTAAGGNTAGSSQFAQTFVLRPPSALLYSANLALTRCDTNLNLIGDRAEIRPPKCRIASGSGVLRIERKSEYVKSHRDRPRHDQFLRGDYGREDAKGYRKCGGS